jgi:hypothetical protein
VLFSLEVIMKAFKVFNPLSLLAVIVLGLPLGYAQPFDLTGLWQNPGGSAIYRVRQMGNAVYWSVDGTAAGSYANVFVGEISGTTLTGTWVDLPGSPSLGGGTLTLQIQSNDYFIKVGESNLYAAQEWVRQGSSTLSGISGRWRLNAVIPSGQPYPGTYTIDINLTESNGILNGSGTWFNGVNSNFTGEIRNGNITLYRTDTSGFRGTFYGTLRPDGQMEGTGNNDPSSPGGNTATYTWTAVRLP